MKEDTDSDDSQFSDLHKTRGLCQDGEPDSDEESRFSDCQELTLDPGEVQVKEEPTYGGLERVQADKYRKYGDRVLLARQSKDGMMKLGGGNQATYLFPKNDEERKARLGGKFCVAYNCKWNL